MNERIAKIVQKTVSGEMLVKCAVAEFDREDLFLSPVSMAAKRICEYIMNQEPVLIEESLFTGFIRFEPRRGNVKNEIVGDIFKRSGHTNLNRLDEVGYANPWYNLITFEWQHSAGDFGKVINIGIVGVLDEIEASMEKHRLDAEKTEFLQTQKLFCNTLIKFANKCSDAAWNMAQKTEKPEYKNNLRKLSEALKKVPEKPAGSFYEAVLSLYFLYAYLPDSIGLIDRYLYPYFKKDLESGVLTKEQAKEYLQELFCMIQAKTDPINDARCFHRGGECNFAVGGYLENGEDGFNDFSAFIVEALIDLPIWAPQISFRWNSKTKKEVLRYMMDCERKDPHKRIVFINDDKRIKGFTQYHGMTFEEAVKYTSTGCNEIIFPGGTVWDNSKINIARSLENTFFNRSEDILDAKDFEEFYKIYEQELVKDLNEAKRIAEGMQKVRHRDFNIVSNFLLAGCIENGISCTQKEGVTRYVLINALIGLTNVFDSLSVIKRFVYDEKLATMQDFVTAVKSNWQGQEQLRTLVIKKGHFFGNDDEAADGLARKVLDSIRKWNTADNYFGKKWLFGSGVGYNDHHRIFGEALKATPDGRYAGDMIKFGIGQSEGKDKNGLAALLNSIAKLDRHAILTGNTVINILLDEALVRNDASFSVLVELFETYLRECGLHFQLSYVSHEDLVNAKAEPDKYSSLRVRVSGFSEYFVNLNEGHQNDLIARTTKSRV